jgi:hypothetical protein
MRSPILKLLGLLFTKYRVVAAKLHHAAALPTDDPAKYTFAFSSDPMHPLLWTATADRPSSANLQAMDDSVVFAGWDSWSLDVTHALRAEEWLYTSHASATSGVFLATNEAIQPRFTDFGTISCTYDQPRSGGSYPQRTGMIYLEAEVEFDQFAPLVSTVTGSSSLLLSDPQAIETPILGYEKALALLDETHKTCLTNGVVQPQFIGALISAVSAALPAVMSVINSAKGEEHKEDSLLQRLEPLLQQLASQMKK